MKFQTLIVECGPGARLKEKGIGARIDDALSEFSKRPNVVIKSVSVGGDFPAVGFNRAVLVVSYEDAVQNQTYKK